MSANALITSLSRVHAHDGRSVPLMVERQLLAGSARK